LFFDICFLRDPIDRIRSMYDYFRERPAAGDPMSDLAQTTDLGDFIAGLVDRFQLYIKNVQVNLIACAGDSDEPEEKDLKVAHEPLAVLENSKSMAPPAQPVRPALRTRVKRALQAVRYADVWFRPRNRRLFDANYYQGSLWEFLIRGGYEGRSPHPLFDSDFYL